jgi:hypothetical protein
MTSTIAKELRELVDLNPHAYDVVNRAADTLDYLMGAALGKRTEMDGLKAEIVRLKDDPIWDGIEGANPAWWRGHEHTSIMLCKKVSEILDGKDDGHRWARQPWESVRRRLGVLGADAARYRWLLSAAGLDLRSDGSTWSREGNSFVAPFSLAANGTRYGAYPTLDELIDNAMKETI